MSLSFTQAVTWSRSILWAIFSSLVKRWFDFIDLFPLGVKLLPLGAYLLVNLGAFVKVRLNLARHFQPCDETMAEHAQVRETFGFGLSAPFL